MDLMSSYPQAVPDRTISFYFTRMFYPVSLVLIKLPNSFCSTACSIAFPAALSLNLPFSPSCITSEVFYLLFRYSVSPRGSRADEPSIVPFQCFILFPDAASVTLLVPLPARFPCEPLLPLVSEAATSRWPLFAFMHVFVLAR